MSSPLTLVCLFLLLSFTSHPVLTNIVTDGGALPKLETDLSGVPLHLMNDEVAVNVDENEELDGPDEGDGREGGLMPAALRSRWRRINCGPRHGSRRSQRLPRPSHPPRLPQRSFALA
ncbi:hypothetical protein ECG_03019 [Echinococcus granulosus]|uniref:Uncharacterized protein n=1 Tax=Echinococcus granulosus TaxID=6210 RepID=W6V9E8_ECHGR|nr:hypothetical protein EGR_01725 [Echinococcus granulosus]EUB63234.1 hypothetical protein EGR_01725 [Echinococcus granulosus]KAH9284476.1 hypothetical protein ECG_03019 [Echinococcus granulosus]